MRHEHLDVLSGEKASEIVCVTEPNEILLNITPNSQIKQAYFQVFDYESINFIAAVNIFERIETEESMYKDVVEPYYKTY